MRKKIAPLKKSDFGFFKKVSFTNPSTSVFDFLLENSFVPSTEPVWYQILAKRGPASRFVFEANSKPL